MIRKTALVLIACLVVVWMFGWGFIAHRSQIFPYGVVRKVAETVGLTTPRRVSPRTQAGRLETLESLPYLQSSFDPRHEERGVLIHDRTKAFEGYNFYNISNEEHVSDLNRAYLIDMEGRVLHEWARKRPDERWHHAELLDNGDLLVVQKDKGVLRLDKSSDVVWSWSGRAHHDLWVHDDGDIYVIAREPVVVPQLHSTRRILAEKIVVLSQEGVQKREIPLLSPLLESTYRIVLPSVAHLPDEGDDLDLLHANHVEVFDGSNEQYSPLFRRGNILISVRHTSTVAILDGSSAKILWLWGPTNISWQHHPRLLENGNILLFDNGTSKSRVIEISVPSGAIHWSYGGGDDSFYSSWGGANERLPNGNTLITETATGYVFEVTPEGETVWQFANPDVGEDGKRMNIWRMTRFDPNASPFLASIH